MSATKYFKDRRILALVAIVLALLALDAVYGLHFGIEFVGGTQIPVTLAYGVNATQMSSIISVIDQRVSTFGLKQITVQGVGNSTIYVTVPSSSSSDVNQTISIIESQGNFQGIVNGREAINGTGIIRDSIGALPPQPVNGTVEWSVDFYITQAAVTPFSNAVLGQANQPLHMFLDRPNGAVILVNGSILGNSTQQISAQDALSAMSQAMSLGNESVPVLAVYGSNYSVQSAISFLSSHKSIYNKVLASVGLNSSVYAAAKEYNYSLELESNANMTPSYFRPDINLPYSVDSWTAVGLLSSPPLSPSLTNGTVGTQYQITGSAPTNIPATQKLAYAQTQIKMISSILSGGALPVSVIVGAPTTVPATLGQYFLEVSSIILLIAVIAMSLFIMIRYRHPFLVIPIICTTLMELFIIVSIIGLIGTIDLSALAGMIAVVGTGVDSQVIITDEILTKHSTHQGSLAKSIMSNAFYIVMLDAMLIIVAMLPLFFSTSFVNVIGFSESTIIGAILGVMITRPAYGAIISKRYE